MTTTSLHGALRKFSVKAGAGKSHVRAIQEAQERLKLSESRASAAGCKTLHLFNYLFFFGPSDTIANLRHEPTLSAPNEPWRQFEANFDGVLDVAGDLYYASWLLAVAHLPISKRADRDRIAPGCITIADWMIAFRSEPAQSQVESTFRPTTLVGDRRDRVKRFRQSDDVDLRAFGNRIQETKDASLCILDGDGIKASRFGDKRASLYALHENALRTILPRLSEDPIGTFESIYDNKLEIDGLFDDVISEIVWELRRFGHLACYIGGDEVLTLAPLDTVRIVTERVCERAPFEIAFSCGAVPSAEFETVDEGLVMAERRLVDAKSAKTRVTFNCWAAAE